MSGKSIRNKWKDIQNQASAQFANHMSRNVQMGTEKAIEGMELFKWKAVRLENVGFEQSKGNLFEYIENAKLQRNLANKGFKAEKNFLTDAPKDRMGYSENTAPDDFRFMKNGRIIGQGQAKYNNNPHQASVNFTNPKYTDMQRIAPIDQMDAIRECLDKMVSKGEISTEAYENAVNNLQYQGLMDPNTKISSGGTTTTEIRSLCGDDGKVSIDAVKKYAMHFEYKQYAKEVITTVGNSTAVHAVTRGIVSGVENAFDVLNDRKKLNEALKDIGVDVVKGAARGGATGFISSILHIGGTKAGVPVISDSTSATVIAGSIIDGGGAVYAYTKGEISAEELSEELKSTTVKATATIYFTKTLANVIKTSNPFVSIAIYSVAGYIVSASREIINNAKLSTQEHRRATELLEESTKLMKEYHQRMNDQMEQYEQKQRQLLQSFLNDFEYNVLTGENYDNAIWSIINFANQTGIALEYVDFDEFRDVMMTDEDIVLK